MMLRCILCVLSGCLIAGMMLSLMASGSNAAEDKKPDERKAEDKKPDDKSDRAKKILEALDEPGANPKSTPKPMPKPMGKGPRAGKGIPMAPVNVPEIPPAQRVAQMLAAADSDGGGTISRQEFGDMLDAMGPIGQQLAPRLAGVFRKVDTNRDGQLSSEEAVKGMQDFVAVFFPEKGERAGNRPPQGNQVDPQIAALAQVIVGRLDRNKDGKISEQEAGNDKEVASRFAMADADQDKQLSPEEIYAFLQKSLPMLRADNK